MCPKESPSPSGGPLPFLRLRPPRSDPPPQDRRGGVPPAPRLSPPPPRDSGPRGAAVSSQAPCYPATPDEPSQLCSPISFPQRSPLAAAAPAGNMSEATAAERGLTAAAPAGYQPHAPSGCSICMLGGLGVGSALLKGTAWTKAVLALFVLPFPTPFPQLLLLKRFWRGRTHLLCFFTLFWLEEDTRAAFCI